MVTREKTMEAAADTQEVIASPAEPPQAQESVTIHNPAPFFERVKTINFVAPAQSLLIEFPTMRWGKGVKVIGGSGVKKAALYTGGLIEQGQDSDLDEVMSSEGVPWVTVEHLSKNRTNFWRFDTFEAFILCKGVPQHYSDDCTLGVPYTWNAHPGFLYGAHLECMMFLRRFLASYPKPVVFSLSRLVIQHFLNEALLKQFKRVLEPLEEAWQAIDGNQDALNLAYYAFSLDVIKGEEVEAVGQRGSSMIKPPVADMAVIDQEYLEKHFIQPKELMVVEPYLSILDRWSKDAVSRLQQPYRGPSSTKEGENE